MEETIEDSNGQGFIFSIFDHAITEDKHHNANFYPLPIGRGFDAARQRPRSYCNDLNKTFTENFLPHKILHSIGRTGEIDLDIVNDLGYTGVLKKTGQPKTGFIRFSLGNRPNHKDVSANASFAIKFPRSGVHDADAFAMWDFEGQSFHNMFQHMLSNNIATPIALTDSAEDQFQRKLNRHQQFPGGCSLKDLASIDVDGSQKKEQFCKRFKNGSQTECEEFGERVDSKYPWAILYIPNPV